MASHQDPVVEDLPTSIGDLTVTYIYLTGYAMCHQVKLHLQPLKSPIDASNSSNTIKLFLKYTDVLYMTNYDIIYI